MLLFKYIVVSVVTAHPQELVDVLSVFLICINKIYTVFLYMKNFFVLTVSLSFFLSLSPSIFPHLISLSISFRALNTNQDLKGSPPPPPEACGASFGEWRLTASVN